MYHQQLTTAIKLLLEGKPIAFPTDTIYGLGADPTSEQGISSIFILKQRPLYLPLPILLSEIGQIYDWLDLDSLVQAKLNKLFFKLIENFWPGSLTIVVKKNKKVSNLLTANNDSIAIRIPNHQLTLNLLKTFGRPIIGSSANKHGMPTTVNAKQVQDLFGDQVFVLEDGSESAIGIESTIVSLVDIPKIIRSGAIDKEKLLSFYNFK